MHDKTIIIPLQNGWGSIDLIQQYFNKERILPAVTYMGANVISKGIVQKGGDGITYLCGSQQPEIQKQVQRLQQAWSIVGKMMILRNISILITFFRYSFFYC